MNHDEGALSGLRVLDVTQMLAGPLAGARLGDLGADVIKVEPPGGEFNRTHGFEDITVGGDMSTFLAVNRNKRSLCVDLKSDGRPPCLPGRGAPQRRRDPELPSLDRRAPRPRSSDALPRSTRASSSVRSRATATTAPTVCARVRTSCSRVTAARCSPSARRATRPRRAPCGPPTRCRRSDDPAFYRRIVVITKPGDGPSHLVHTPTGGENWVVFSRSPNPRVDIFPTLRAALNSIRPVLIEVGMAADGSVPKV